MHQILANFSIYIKNFQAFLVDFKSKKLSQDKDEGTYSGVTFYLTSGIASTHCTDYSEKMPYTDNLRINMKSQEYEDWLWIKDPY